MMVLDTFNMSATIDIEGVGKAFDVLTLSSFPGENISALATSALKYIKVMNPRLAGRFSTKIFSTTMPTQMKWKPNSI